MKKVLFIGNRLNALIPLTQYANLEIIKIYVLRDSLLHQRLDEVILPDNIVCDVFGFKDKQRLFAEIQAAEFDLLISNGCPFILPVSKMKKPHQLFINIHPTLLPALKGKTPLSGVFMTHQSRIGATMHYIDDGIDTGGIIAQEGMNMTDDIDQGLVYKLSFDMEAVAFKRGMDDLVAHDFKLAGTKQEGEGSYFNRTDDMQAADAVEETTSDIMDKIRSFGIHTQGTVIKLRGSTFRVFSAEQMHNHYVLKWYAGVDAGTIAAEYDGKLLVRTKDGLLKLIDYEKVDS